MKTTNNLFLIGFMGAGKSSVSAALGKKLGWNVIEMDERIAADEGMSIPEIFAQKGEAHFRACETALLYSFAKGDPCIVSWRWRRAHAGRKRHRHAPERHHRAADRSPPK